MMEGKNKKWYQTTWFKLLCCSGFVLGALLVIFLSRDPTLFLMMSKPEAPSSTLPSQKLSIEDLDQSKIEASMKRALKFFKAQQKDDGSWMGHAGITAMSLSSILKTPFEGIGKEAYLQSSLSYLLDKQQENGAFYTPFSVSVGMANYITSCTVMALAAANREKYTDQISRGLKYLESAQRTEGLSEGGMGYSAQGSSADLGNLHMALKAMKEAGVDSSSPFYQKALAFINKCQDSESNENVTSTATGGFAYKPEALMSDHQSEDGEISVYGGVTYAGLDSLLLCDVDMNDPRVQDVFHWIEHNYSVDQHPGKGDLSLFFYYATMAKALHLSEVKVLKTKFGEKKWAYDLALKVINMQREDGSWVNENPKYFEGYSVMASAYALQALNYCWKSF